MLNQAKTVFLIGYNPTDYEKHQLQMNFKDFIKIINDYDSQNVENYVHNILEVMHILLYPKANSPQHKIKNNIYFQLSDICKKNIHIAMIFEEEFYTCGSLKSHLLNMISEKSIYTNVINVVLTEELDDIQIKDVLKKFLYNPCIKTTNNYTNEEINVANILINMA